MRNKVAYGYCVKIRFRSDLHTQPEWVTVSAHTALEGAEKNLRGRKSTAGRTLKQRFSPPDESRMVTGRNHFVGINKMVVG